MSSMSLEADPAAGAVTKDVGCTSVSSSDLEDFEEWR